MSYIFDVCWRNYPDKKKRALFLVLIFITVLRLWLSAAQMMRSVPLMGYDDMLFLVHAVNIAHGKWLGAYDQNTLVKGVFYPLFIAVNHYIGLPLLFTQQLLFVFACVVSIRAISPFVKSPIVLAVCYVIFLFNPGSYTSMATTRVIRDFVCGSCALLAVSCMAAMYIRLFARKPIRIVWPILMGLAFAGAWLTREDSVWVLPFLVVVTILCLILVLLRRKEATEPWAIAMLVLPFLIFGACNLLVAGVNAYAYGIFITNEYAEPHFLSAYDALSRIDAGKSISKVTVTKAARMQAYAVSPAFRELQPYLDGGKMAAFVDANGETPGTLFTWNLRNAVAAAGYYKTPAAASAYYQRLAAELNDAFAKGKLRSYPQSISLGMLSPWRSQFLQPTLDATLAGIRYNVTFRDCDPRPEQSDPFPAGIALYQAMTYDISNLDYASYFTDPDKLPPVTGGEGITLDNGSSLYQKASSLTGKRIGILHRFTELYQIGFPVLFALSVLCYAYLTVCLILTLRQKRMRRIGPSWLISTGVFLTFLLRVSIFAYGSVSSDVPFSPQYMSPAYFQMMFFTLFTIGTAVTLLQKQITALRPKPPVAKPVEKMDLDACSRT